MTNKNTSIIPVYYDYLAGAVVLFVFSIPLAVVSLYFSCKGVVWTWIPAIGGVAGILCGCYMSNKSKTNLLLSDAGISVMCGKKEILPFENWSVFRRAFFLKIEYDTGRFDFSGQRQTVAYFVLMRQEANENEIRNLAIRLIHRFPYFEHKRAISVKLGNTNMDVFQDKMKNYLDIETRQYSFSLGERYPCKRWEKES